MTRRTANILTALSLTLCVVAAGLWARSYRYQDTLSWPWSDTRHAQLYSAHGGLSYFHINTQRSDTTFGFRSLYIEPQDRNPHLAGSGVAGFRVYNDRPLMRFWTVPYWFLFGLAATGPAVRLVGTRRTARRSRLGLCPQCGYDLRATPGRCPECGAEAVALSSEQIGARSE